jgi:hypothetical protein
MDTSMLGRVAALLIRDLGRSRVIFLAFARGQELVVSIFISGWWWCWGPSAFEGPQKHDLTMFSKWNVWEGIFGIGLRAYKFMAKTKLEWEGRWLWRRKRSLRSYMQKSFSITAERETDLKMKSQIRPRRITIELLINVKGINVILHGLRPMPINRWIVLSYCSRWLGIRFWCHTCIFTPSSRRYICNLMLFVQIR